MLASGYKHSAPNGASEKAIRHLHWKDFELLVDLIFRQTGWRRECVLGKSLKTHDMVLISPLTKERLGVQVKAKANLAEFEDYRAACYEDMKGFAHFRFAVHTPSPDLEGAAKNLDDDKVKLLLPTELAHLTIEYGMANRVIDKAQ